MPPFEPPPAMAKPLVDLFRADIEAKAGADLDRLSEAVADQKAYARIAPAILCRFSTVCSTNRFFSPSSTRRTGFPGADRISAASFASLARTSTDPCGVGSPSVTSSSSTL